MDINLECSDIMNEDYSQFFDANSQICLNEESFVQTPSNQSNQIINLAGAINSGGSSSQHNTQPLIISKAQDYNNIQGFKLNQQNSQCASKQVLAQGQVLIIQEQQPVVNEDNQQLLEEQEVEIRAVECNTKEEIQMLNLVQINLKTNSFTSIPSNSDPNVQESQNEQIQKAPNEQTNTANSQSSCSQTSKPNLNTQWQKVSFTKRRVGNAITSNNNTNGNLAADKNTSMFTNNKSLSAVSSIQNRLLQKQNTMNPTNKGVGLSQLEELDQNQNNGQHSQLSQLPQIKEPYQKKKKSLKSKQPGEPLPVFDCLFCCQEHFVLSSISEQILNKKFAKNKIHHEQQKDKLIINMAMKEFGYAVFKELDQRICENQQKFGDYLSENDSYNNPSIIPLKDTLQILKENAASVSQAKFSPLVLKLSDYCNKLKKQKPAIPVQYERAVEKNQQSQQQQQTVVVDKSVSQAKEEHNNFLGLTQNSLIDESNFGLINLRTRRQKVLQSISFESEYHNIYDPNYTSEEENYSVSLQDSESEELSEDLEEFDDNDQEQEEDEEISQDANEDDEEVEDGDGDDEYQNLFNKDEDEVDEDYYSEIDEEEKEFKEIVEDCDRIVEVQHITSDDQILKAESIPENANHSCISSIEQESDEDDAFVGSDEDAQTPIINNSNFGKMHHQFKENLFLKESNSGVNIINNHNNLNIQENPIVNEEYDDELSERYTFGCVTPKNDYDLGIIGLNQPKVTFSNYQGETSLSPVRSNNIQLIQIQQQLRQADQKKESQQSAGNKKNALLLDISPVSVNNTRKNFIILSKDENNNTKDGENFLINSYNEGEAASLRGRLDFYPSQEIDSIDIHTTQEPTVILQQKVSSVIEDDIQRPISYQSESKEYDTVQQVMTQCFTNNNQPDFKQTVPQSQSFTTTNYKQKHQRLIPQPKNVKGNEEIQILNNLTLDSQNQPKSQFYFNKEYLNEILKKAKMLKTKQDKITQLNHLVSFDSVQKTSQIESNEKNPKQKLQTICTPIETNDNLLTFPLYGQHSKTNKTTVNQAGRRQNSNNIGNVMTCKNNTSSQQNILLSGEIPVNQLLTNRKIADFNSTNGLKQVKKNHQKLIENNYIDNIQALRTVQTTTAKSNINIKQKTQNPILIKNDKSTISSLNNNAFANIQVNQLSNKDQYQILRSALCSSRYSSTSTNPANMNNLNLLKQSIDNTNNNTNQNKSIGKKKRKSRTKQNHSNSITETKKSIKTKKSLKKKKVTKQNPMDCYYQQQQSQQEIQNCLNVGNSINFSNDYSIPSHLSNGIMATLNQKSISINSGHLNNQSSQNNLMYLSMQDGKNLFTQNNGCNKSNFQDTSNNYPYGGSIQAEMSTTCISNGCNSNKQQNSTYIIKRDNNIIPCKQDLQKLNGSVEEMSLYNMLTFINKHDKKLKVNQRDSVSIQKSTNFNPDSNEKTNPDLMQTGIIPGHSNQFSFSQNNLKLNQTAGVSKNGVQKRKPKAQQQAISYAHIHSTSSSSTLKNTSQQLQRRDALQRTRSNSKNNQNIIKTDLPTHQLLLQNKGIIAEQHYIKNNKILLKQQENNLKNNIVTKTISITKDKVISTNNNNMNKTKKSLKIVSNQHHSNVQTEGSNYQIKQQRNNQQKVLSKGLMEKQNNISIALQNFQDLGKFYGTGKIMMSHVTSPIRPSTSQIGLHIGQSFNIVNSSLDGIVRKELFQTNNKDQIDFKK